MIKTFLHSPGSQLKMLMSAWTYIYYLPAGRSVLRKTVPEVLSTARGRRPRAVLKTEGTVFLNTDRPRPANNIFIFSCCFSKVKRVLLFSESNVLQARVK